MLFGGFDHKIDKKGRVFIPSTFREELGESFIMIGFVVTFLTAFTTSAAAVADVPKLIPPP